MYTFIIKENGPALDMILTRALITLSAIAVLVYGRGDYYYLNLFSCAVLLAAAVFIKLLYVKFSISKFILLSAAAVVLFITTRSIAFALILLVYGYLVKFLKQEPTIAITNKGTTIKKLFSSRAYPWTEFSNIVLKDNVLTLDFKNNKLIQVSIDQVKATFDEADFNEFCQRYI